MGLTLDRTHTIAGYRPAIFKRALQGFARTRNPGNLIDLRSVFPLRRDGAIVFEECLDRGLINGETLEPTEAGEALARAKAQPRTPLAKAKLVLDELLDRARALNADADALFYVDEIWLFGSLLRQQDTVGDIDLAISTTRNRRHDLHSDGYASLVDERFYLVADAPQTLRYWYNREDWLRERAIFGVKRHPLLAGAQDGMDDLVSLAVPCRLLFDRKRGGRVDDDVLEQHPKSTQRSDTLRPQNVSLELAPSQIRPMDARWVSGFQPSGYVEPSPIFRGWTDDARRVFSRYPRDLRVFVDDFVLGQFPWRPKALKAGGLDGRQRVLIANATEFSGVSIVLNRRIEILPDRWVLHAELSNVELYRSRLYVDLASLSPIQGAAALILAADAEHMVRRAFEVEARPAIEIRLGRGNVLPDIQNWLIDTLYRMIKTRMIAIEPAGVQRTVSIKRV